MFDYRDINYAHILNDTSKLRPDFLQDYPDANEKVDKNSLKILEEHSKLQSMLMEIMHTIA